MISNALIKILWNAHTYLTTFAWIITDVWQTLKWKWVVAQTVLAFSMVLELGVFISTVKLIATGRLDIYLVLVLVVALSVGTLGSFWSRSRFLALAMDYERSLVTRFLKMQLPAAVLREVVSRNTRQITTVVRHLTRLPVHLLAALPAFAALSWLAPGLTAFVFILLLLSAVPLYSVNRASSRSMDALYAANQGAAQERKALLSGTDADIETEQIFENSRLREAQDSYQSVLIINEASKLVSGLAMAAVLGAILIVFLQGGLSIETAVIYTVGTRFLMSQIDSIASALTSMNRFYRTLTRVRELIRDHPVSTDSADPKRGEAVAVTNNT